MSYRDNITRIRTVHDAFGDLAAAVVFVGGATASLYANRQTTEVRPTDDVDILVEIWTRSEYAAIEEVLRTKGFNHAYESGILCRFTIHGITVDVMPIDASVLGFTNRWYDEGYRQSVPFAMDEYRTVRIFSAPYFIASKLEAFKGRGGGDGRTSHDFEDIVYVLNNRSKIWTELKSSPDGLRTYLIDEIAALLQNPYIEELI